MSKLQETIRETVLRLSTPGMDPDALLEAVKQEHPGASKKAIIQAALGCVIELTDHKPLTAKQLQDFAISRKGRSRP